MGKKEQVPALAIFVQGSLWVWSPRGGFLPQGFTLRVRIGAARG